MTFVHITIPLIQTTDRAILVGEAGKECWLRTADYEEEDRADGEITVKISEQLAWERGLI